jgi:hypothetical protein
MCNFQCTYVILKLIKVSLLFGWYFEHNASRQICFKLLSSRWQNRTDLSLSQHTLLCGALLKRGGGGGEVAWRDSLCFRFQFTYSALSAVSAVHEHALVDSHHLFLHLVTKYLRPILRKYNSICSRGRPNVQPLSSSFQQAVQYYSVFYSVTWWKQHKSSPTHYGLKEIHGVDIAKCRSKDIPKHYRHVLSNCRYLLFL